MVGGEGAAFVSHHGQELIACEASRVFVQECNDIWHIRVPECSAGLWLALCMVYEAEFCSGVALGDIGFALMFSGSLYVVLA